METIERAGRDLSDESISFSDFDCVNLWIVSRTVLIKMKRLAGRPQDLTDIERLENEES